MEDIISMSPFSIKLLIIGLAIVVLVLTAYYRIDGFDSDPKAGTRGCDETCTGFGFSKLSGRPCCHPKVDPIYPKSQKDCSGRTTFIEGTKPSENYCAVCVLQENGTTECHQAGSYDTNKFKAGTINEETSKTDVRNSPAEPTYLTQLKEIRKLEADLHEGRDADGRELYRKYFPNLYDDDGIISSKKSDLGRSESETNTSGANGKTGSKGGSWSNSNYWSNGKSGSKGGKWNTTDTEIKRKTLDELMSNSDNYNTIPGFDDTTKDSSKDSLTPSISSTDDEALSKLIDNRLKSCKKLQDRFLERPSEEKYDTGAGKGADTCNNYKSCNDEEEEEEVCEGFSPIL